MSENMSPAQRAAETRHQRHEDRKEEFSATLNDRRRAVEVCRSIRDSEDCGPVARLRAVELLMQIQGK